MHSGPVTGERTLAVVSLFQADLSLFHVVLSLFQLYPTIEDRCTGDLFSLGKPLNSRH